MGFSIPERLRNVGATGVDLICWVAMARGNATPTHASPGQIALADWLMADPGRRAQAIDLSPALSLTLIQRILAGELAPGELAAIAIEVATDEAVQSELWELPGVPIEGCAEALPDPEPPQIPFCQGRLGSVPPGRLFTVVRDYRGAEEFVLTGLGLALRLDRAALAAIHQASGQALAHGGEALR
jgi:hypothetical protein